jgi:hypothetical protein
VSMPSFTYLSTKCWMSGGTVVGFHDSVSIAELELKKQGHWVLRVTQKFKL